MLLGQNSLEKQFKEEASTFWLTIQGYSPSQCQELGADGYVASVVGKQKAKYSQLKFFFLLI